MLSAVSFAKTQFTATNWYNLYLISAERKLNASVTRFLESLVWLLAFQRITQQTNNGPCNYFVNKRVYKTPTVISMLLHIA